MMGAALGLGTMGGGYLQTIVMTSSPSISRPWWKRTMMLLVKTRAGRCERQRSKNDTVIKTNRGQIGFLKLIAKTPTLLIVQRRTFFFFREV